MGVTTVFENLSGRLSDVFEGLKRRGILTEADVAAAMRDVRLALLEADVSLPVVRSFIKKVNRKATGQAVMRSVTPGHQVIKIVHDELVEMLNGDGGNSADLRIDNPPAPILMVGLQGSGKTTTTAKLARRLSGREGKRVLMASLDTHRPAAMEQLRVLGVQSQVDTLPIMEGQDAVEIAKRATNQAKLGGYDVLLLDTAGRLHVDRRLMDEVIEIRDIANPRETLLVADGLTGQDAVNVAEEFKEKVGISGVILTRMEGDGRGGSALSMRAVTGKPIKFIGTGEKLDDLGEFDPERIAGRILGMGDIVSLVEKAAETLEMETAERAMRRMQKGLFNLNDMRKQLEAMEKMGGMQSMMSMMPGMQKHMAQAEAAGLDSKFVKRQIGLINSMTRKERANPKILQASRRKRIAAGAGMEVADLNRLLKMHKQMSTMSKMMSKRGLGGALNSLFGGGSSLPIDPSAAMGSGTLPGAAGKLPADFNLPPGMAGRLPGGMELPSGLAGGKPRK